jgi:Ricin-type beta-trefoil lectin domain-like
MVITVVGGSAATDARVEQRTHRGEAHRRFALTPAEDGYYRLVADHSGLPLGVSGRSRDAGAPVVQSAWNSDGSQRFRLVARGGGHFAIVAKHSGMALRFGREEPADGARLVQVDPSEGDLAQSWRVMGAPLRLGDGSGQLGTTAIEIMGDVPGPRSQLTEAPASGEDRQRFHLEPVDDGWYRVLSELTGLVFDVPDQSRDERKPIWLSEWNGGDNQLFRLIARDHGSYNLVAKHSGLVLTLDGNPRILVQHKFTSARANFYV